MLTVCGGRRRAKRQGACRQLRGYSDLSSAPNSSSLWKHPDIAARLIKVVVPIGGPLAAASVNRQLPQTTSVGSYFHHVPVLGTCTQGDHSEAEAHSIRRESNPIRYAVQVCDFTYVTAVPTCDKYLFQIGATDKSQVVAIRAPARIQGENIPHSTW